MARRTCGTLKLTIKLNHRSDGYFVVVTDPDGGRYHAYIGAPASGFGPGIAYDSPAAYDATAHAAVSFLEHDGGECQRHTQCERVDYEACAATTDNPMGWAIARS